ncbi:helix-turn-helix domain-containing protein [Streptomyces virginiae]|nr:IclR family transcriptional regulator C-terminal domain-containing protein [Streptomyces virginiae]WSC82193.1 helix-turn-helix domain-containing protein [Streptomyces virginiae]
MTRNHADAGDELDEALLDAEVFTDEYAFYDEDAARRRIARRIAAARQSRAMTQPVASDAQLALPPAGRPSSSADRKLVLDAACNVRAARALDSMARALVDSPAFTRLALDVEAWPHSQPSALLFASLLHLSGRGDGAQFWFQYAAGAGSDTAARALYLLHLSRAEISIARHWHEQPPTPDQSEDLLPLPEVDTVEDTLQASIIWTSPPISTAKITPTPHTRPNLRQLPAPIHAALETTTPEEDEDLGDVYLPTPRLASALARCAHLDPAGLAADAKPGARMAKRPKRLQPVNTQLEAAQRALRVLEVIHRYTGGVSRTQIARETGLPQLHLAHAVEHLVRTQLATPVAPGVYAAGSSLKLAESGRTAGALLRETLAFLRDEVGAAVYVAAYTDGEVSITQYADSPTAPAVHEWVDFREAAHASAVGKALLVQLDPAERRDHLGRHHMEAFTPHTITSAEELFAELDTRDPGEPLVDLQEYALGTVCAAVPIRTGTDPECVALSLPTPDPLKLAQAARVLRNEAIAVLLALLVGGSNPPPPIASGIPCVVIPQ